MLKDFEVVNAVGIRTQGIYFDIHNEFDLVQIRLRPPDRTVELEFAATARKPTGAPATIVLQFLDVDWLQISPRVFLSDNCEVLEFGYKEPTDDNHDWLIREVHWSPDLHFFLRLSGDEFVRLLARRAKAIL